MAKSYVQYALPVIGDECMQIGCKFLLLLAGSMLGWGLLPIVPATAQTLPPLEPPLPLVKPSNSNSNPAKNKQTTRPTPKAAPRAKDSKSKTLRSPQYAKENRSKTPRSPQHVLVTQFLQQLNQGQWPQELVSAEFDDELVNEFEQGRGAILLPGSLGRLESGSYLPEAPFYNFELKERPPDSAQPRTRSLRVIPNQGEWQIDGIAPRDMAQPVQLSSRRDNGLPTSNNRLFNNVRLAGLPALTATQQQQARQMLEQLYALLNDPERDLSQVTPLLSLRLRTNIRNFDTLLSPGNLRNLYIEPYPDSTAVVRVQLVDQQLESYLGLAAFTVVDGQLRIDALGYSQLGPNRTP